MLLATIVYFSFFSGSENVIEQPQTEISQVPEVLPETPTTEPEIVTEPVTETVPEEVVEETPVEENAPEAVVEETPVEGSAEEGLSGELIFDKNSKTVKVKKSVYGKHQSQVDSRVPEGWTVVQGPR